MGAFKDQPEYVGYDKGDFIAHCNDGQVVIELRFATGARSEIAI